MGTLLLVVLALASVWDGFTTIYGTLWVLGGGLFQIIAALLFSALILGFVLNTRRILKWRTNFMGFLLKFFWFIAVCYDFFTSWIANTDLIIRGERTTTEFVMLLGLTLLVTGSPVLLSVLWAKKFPRLERDQEQVSGYS